jgi:asparagine synthase (glutamine-hydrolysing)
MTISPVPTPTPDDEVRVPVVPDRAPWRSISLTSGASCWLSGYTTGADDESAAASLAAAAAADRPEAALITWARETLGHGAALYWDRDQAVGITDVAATVPLFLARAEGSDGLRATVGRFTDGSLDEEAALQLAMGGFTIGERCLIPSLRSLRPGTVAIVRRGETKVVRHARYLGPVEADADPRDPALRKRHNDLLLGIVEDMVRSVEGRRIAVPLSAGLDSRAILCALKEVGYDRVTSFSYGLPGNHEAAGARKVAMRLGVPWRMIDYSPSGQRRFFESETARNFLAFADRPDAMPFMQDVPALERLIAEGGVGEDAVFVNGQSGDFIAGNHIPRALVDGAISLEDAVIEKHFDMWRHLKTPENLDRIKAALAAEFSALDGDVPVHAAYELLEHEARQSKYVCAGQRAYEFFNRDWRLPLWDARYVAFWRGMPVEAKLGRRLFVEALTEVNWGGVWGADWVFHRTIVPAWLRPFRLSAKLLCAPFGRKTWHRVEKRLFDWRMDPVQNYAIVPWLAVAASTMGHRNALSWHARDFLKRKGIRIDDGSTTVFAR